MRKNVIAEIRHYLSTNSIDVYFITDIINISYLTSFTGSSAYLVIEQDNIIFFTDSRYDIQSKSELDPYIDINIVKNYNLIISEYLLKYKKITISNQTSLELYNKLNSNNISIDIDHDNIIYKLRMLKEADEISLIKDQYSISARAFKNTLDNISIGDTESKWAATLSYHIINEGAVGESFDTIIASGYRGALPHGRATDKIIESSEPVIIDFGSKIKYNSDYTRVVYNGSDSDVLNIIEIVRTALLKSIDSIRIGMKASELDSIARDYITSEGYGNFFNHSLGHGIGLDVHELPNINPTSDISIENNMVFTIEPGIYLPDKFGIRLEETVLIEKNSATIISNYLSEYIYKLN